MSCLVVILGFLAGFLALVLVLALIQAEFGAAILLAILELILVPIFILCLIKYRSPESKAKRWKAREEWKAGAPERKKQREEMAEAYRERTTIVSTRLIGEGSAEYKKSVGSMVARGAIGSIFGPVGAAIGMATAKNKNTNKNVRRFLVKYLDGHVEEKEATIGSYQYKEYMKYLEWDDSPHDNV